MPGHSDYAEIDLLPIDGLVPPMCEACGSFDHGSTRGELQLTNGVGDLVVKQQIIEAVCIPPGDVLWHVTLTIP
jgi:hypothetical protein